MTALDEPRRPVARTAGRPRGQALSNSLTLFTVGGIDVAVHVSWLVIAGLITWSLATGYFAVVVPEGDAVSDWLLGAVAALLLFASVLVHELAHSFVAKARGLDVRSITLFIFGGVSNLSGEAKRPGAEFQIAIVGPISSFLIALVAFAVAGQLPRGTAAEATASYLAFVNAALGFFNLVPGFPLDGGRVLRSVVWSATNDLRRATEIASAVGQVVAWALMLWGFWRVLNGELLAGIWIAAIGWFLQNAAVASLQQTVLEARIRRLTVGDVLRPDPSAATPDTPVDELIERHILPGARRAVPIALDGRLVGLVTLADVRRVPPEARAATRTADVMVGADRLVTVSSGTPLRQALEELGRGDYEQLPVVDGGRLTGLLTRGALLRELRIREELDLDAERESG